MELTKKNKDEMVVNDQDALDKVFLNSKIGTVMTPRFNVIKDLKHMNKNSIILDENMAQLIRELNSKGYKTIYCCEGHLPYYSRMFQEIFEEIDEYGSDLYIAFKYSKKAEKTLKENLPHGYQIYKDKVFSFKTGKYVSSLIMRMDHSNPAAWKGSDFLYYKYKLSELSNLYGWVYDLPTINNYNERLFRNGRD